jgi:hypothetical protein
MTTWQLTSAEKMRKAGYGFKFWTECRYEECKAKIQMWKHVERGTWMPIDPWYMPHWMSCRKKDPKRTRKPKKEKPPDPQMAMKF